MTAALDEILGAPSVRERVTGELILALGQFDYGPEYEDEVGYPERHREATALLNRIAPMLVEHGRQQAAREALDKRDHDAWDALTRLLCYRPGWHVWFDCGDPRWAFGPTEGPGDPPAITAGEFSHDSNSPTFPFLACHPDWDEGRLLAPEDIAAVLPELEAPRA